jgi:hypothetical protein
LLLRKPFIRFITA